MEIINVNDSRFTNLILEMQGQSCCRQRITLARSISFGFGEKQFHGKTNLIDNYYGEWEIGSYNAFWRIHNGKEILMSYHDEFKSISDLDKKLQTIGFGKFKNLYFDAPFDVIVEFDNGIFIDFIAQNQEYDEIFHIFYNHNQYIEFNLTNGWQTGFTDIIGD